MTDHPDCAGNKAIKLLLSEIQDEVPELIKFGRVRRMSRAPVILVLMVFLAELPLLLQGQLSSSERQKRILALLDRVGLSEHTRHRPNELSGGQRQRVAIARALVTRPSLVLADEPTANLDSVTGQNILDLMKELNRTEKTTFIFSTHDARVMSHASSIVRLADGKLAQSSHGDRASQAELAELEPARTDGGGPAERAGTPS